MYSFIYEVREKCHPNEGGMTIELDIGRCGTGNSFANLRGMWEKSPGGGDKIGKQFSHLSPNLANLGDLKRFETI